ncbi:hypothetical protein SLEP1_g14468 [Rubroshorea leprosula]|uniref:Uncharacterized protein n=1 Tax=Rubroshorea leprosula TaxID=152421 RepID=A0AAV5IJ75_9ROSI|nr:hypothetical protein SLEP1_g14468 [Rubroshorea leprosula]
MGEPNTNTDTSLILFVLCSFLNNQSPYERLHGTVHLVFVGSVDQPADLFTKAHFPGRFCTLLSKLKLVSSQPP